MKYIAVDFNNEKILLQANSQSELNKLLIQFFNDSRFNNIALRKYKVKDDDLMVIEQAMKSQMIPFYQAAGKQKWLQ